MNWNRIRNRVLISLTLLVLVSSNNVALARGFGGGGYRGGGMDGGYRGGGMDGAYRGGMDGFGDGMGGFANRGLDGSGAWGRGDAWGGPQGARDMGGFPAHSNLNDSNAFRDPNFANHDWNSPANAQEHLATDSGFDHIMTSSTAGRYEGVGNRTYRASPAELADRGDLLRTNFNRYDAFDNRNWWLGRGDAWYGGWFDGGWGWDGSTWPDLSGFWDVPESTGPTEYDYGDNITYQNDTVYYGTQPYSSATQYYDQALSLAQSGPSSVTPPTNKSDWRPLGVFALDQGSQTQSALLMELAVNKQGIMRGNYYNTLTNEVKPITGAVDKHSMRAAWTIEGTKDVVYETGISNLLKAQSPILVHFSKSHTEQWTLVRLKQPTQTNTPITMLGDFAG